MVWFKKGRALFRAHELVVVDAVSEALPPAARQLLADQIAQVRKIQRLHDLREVNLYAGRRGAPLWSEDCLFPNRTLELHLATVHLAGTAKRGVAEVHAVRGHTFQIRFRPAPKVLGDLGTLKATHVRLRADPLEAKTGTDTTAQIERIPEPVRSELERLWALPDAGPLVDRDDVFEVDLEDGVYLMLAQLSDTTFCVVRLDPAEGAVRRYDTTGSLVGMYESVGAALHSE